MSRTISAIEAAVAAEDERYRKTKQALSEELAKAQANLRFACDGCERAIRVGDAVIRQYMEFRCPGQTGGYFVNASRSPVCPRCGAETNLYGQPEIKEVPNSAFKSIEKKERG